MTKAPTDTERPLTRKQQRFVEEYPIDLNGAAAARRAGYGEKYAARCAFDNMHNPKVLEAIQAQQAKVSERTGITQDRVLEEIAKIAFLDLRKLFTGFGTLLEPGEWDDDIAGAVASIEAVTRRTGETNPDGTKVVEYVTKIRAWDKLQALDKLARHLGLFDDPEEGDEKVADALREIADKLPG